MEPKQEQRQKLPAGYKAGIVTTLVVFVLAIVAFIGIGLGWFSDDAEAAKNDNPSTEVEVLSSDDPAAAIGNLAEEAEDPEEMKVQDFEDHHRSKGERMKETGVTAGGKIQNFGIAGWLQKNGIPFKLNQNGKIIVPVDRTLKTILPTHDNARTKSAKKVGLSDCAISDALEYVFDLNKAGYNKILEAEKRGIGTKIDFSKATIKDLVRQDVRTMVQNVVVGLAHTDQISGLYYGRSDTVYELSSAVRYLLDETEKAWNEVDEDGEYIGINRWLEYAAEEDTWYCNEDYLANIISVVNQIVDGSEVEAAVIYAEFNWGLERGDYIQLRKAVLSTEPDNLSAIVYKHYFKDGSLMEQPATNLRDRRPEIPGKSPVVKKNKSAPPSVTPSPGYDPEPERHHKPDPVINTRVKPVITPAPTAPPTYTPAPTAPPTYTFPPTPTPIGTKNPDAVPTRRPNDDPGPGEPEPTPKVSKSPSDDVQESQYQPQASPQTGGSSTPREEIINDPSATTAPGGQIVTDPHSDGERTENDRASTDPIDPRNSDTGGREGNNNGEYAPPD